MFKSEFNSHQQYSQIWRIHANLSNDQNISKHIKTYQNISKHVHRTIATQTICFLSCQLRTSLKIHRKILEANMDTTTKSTICISESICYCYNGPAILATGPHVATKIGEGCGHGQLQNLDVDGRRPEQWHWLALKSDGHWQIWRWDYSISIPPILMDESSEIWVSSIVWLFSIANLDSKEKLIQQTLDPLLSIQTLRGLRYSSRQLVASKYAPVEGRIF